MKNIFILLASLFVLSNCTAQRDTKTQVVTQIIEEAPIQKESGMIHTVYFWLVDDITDERKMEFEKAIEVLSTVPSIDKYYWGVPAGTADRDVTNRTYDYALNVFFKNVEDEAKYQIDPIHLAFVEENKAIFKEVIVYDNTYSN